jgi:hypothetical protein
VIVNRGGTRSTRIRIARKSNPTQPGLYHWLTKNNQWVTEHYTGPPSLISHLVLSVRSSWCTFVPLMLLQGLKGASLGHVLVFRIVARVRSTRLNPRPHTFIEKLVLNLTMFVASSWLYDRALTNIWHNWPIWFFLTWSWFNLALRLQTLYEFMADLKTNRCFLKTEKTKGV